MSSRRASTLSVVLVLVTGCARTPPSLPPPVPLEPSEVEALLQKLDLESDSIQRYQGLVRVRGRGPDGGFDAKIVLIFERPDRLRVELLGPFGGTRWSAVAGPDEITAYFPGKQQYLRESDVAEVVARLLGIRLTPKEVMAALSGAGVPLDGTGAKGHRRGDVVVLELDSGAVLEIDGAGQVVSARASQYNVRYPGSWKSRRRTFPEELSIENESVRATLRPEDVDVNVGLDPGAFVLDIPENAVRLRPAEVEGEAVFVIGREPSRERPDGGP